MTKSKQYKHTMRRVLVVGLALTMGLGIAWQALRTEAAGLPNRSVLIGTSVASATTSHRFSFTIGTTTSVGSIQFEYCTNNPLITDPCTVPTGLDVSAATLAAQSGEIGFTIDPSTTANKLMLTRIPTVTVAGTVQYDFTDVINPDQPNQSVYVRLATFASTDGTGTYTDQGGVVFSTSGALTVAAFVPPYITFCVGITVVPLCDVSGDFINLGNLVPTATRSGTSQMAAYTNDDTGYVISMNGVTMTSGNNIITPLSSPSPSIPGVSQFGINLRANALPPAGQDPSGTGTGVVAGDYAIPNRFKYGPGDTLASSPLPTEGNIFTVTYMVNVSRDQPAGIYASTVNYIATAQF